MTDHPPTVSLLRVTLCWGLMAACTASLAGPGPPSLTISQVSAPTFGTFMYGPANRQWALDTAGNITGANAADYQFGAVAGEFIIRRRGGGRQGSGQIRVENVVTTGGLNVESIQCQFHSDPATDCMTSPILGQIRGRRRLLIGVDVTTTQAHAGGDTASVVFDITVTLL